MTEDEAKKALFQIHYDYMMHEPNERLKLYDEYIQKRDEVKKALAKAKINRSEDNIKKYKI